jgi:hypothetical protein
MNRNVRFSALSQGAVPNLFSHAFSWTGKLVRLLGVYAMEFLELIENSGVGVYVREDLWGFAIMLSLHSVGMAMVLGTVLIVNMRVLGMVKDIPILSYAQLFPAAWLGFIINLVSGLALYTSHATTYTFQWVFIMKLLLLAIGGVLMQFVMNSARAGDPIGKTKLFASLCLFCWVGAIITGRLMAYFM